MDLLENYCLLTNYFEMSLFDSYWETSCFVVCEQTCYCGQKNWQNLVTIAWRVWSRTFMTQMNIDNIVIWESQQYIADLDCFKTDFEGDLEDSKSTSGKTLSFLWSQLFVSTSWKYKKQTSVTNRCTGAEIISRCRFTHGRSSRSRSLKSSDWSISFRSEQNRRSDLRESYGECRQQLSSQTCITPSQ